MRARPSLVAAVMLSAGLLLAACGDDDDDSGSPPSGSGDADLTVVAEDSLQFDSDLYTATAGEIAVAYENGGSLLHTLLIDGVDDFKLEVSGSGEVDEGTVELEPGEYELYCDVSGHRAAGMEATLILEE